ncbi:hypothetical protein MJO28_015669 [Puccinia striiformis f. sp. tritici]|uniref:Uncharacterized protein n=1 Tax=Puccinia striiformis f. sp. tritici TaxID=168172 RepID=A0ACC0DQU1_9BASI|nr:hypothetical protein MJO29_015713 [Puccinia striiformis f. sp. tritici]KAI7936770.1 hypothetical protein MJO28_015669 [Puccinia striiformis f. sp. tritici]
MADRSPSVKSEEEIWSPENPLVTSVGVIYAQLCSIQHNHHPSLYLIFSNAMICTCHFENVIKLNDFFLPLIPSPTVLCHSLPIPDSSPEARLGLTATPQTSLRDFPSVTLELKVGMPVRLTKPISTNYNVDKGARLLIVRIDSDVIYARVLVNHRFGRVVRIERLITSCRDPSNPFLTYVRLQYPVEPCFASVLSWRIDDSVRVIAIFKLYQFY